MVGDREDDLPARIAHDGVREPVARRFKIVYVFVIEVERRYEIALCLADTVEHERAEVDVFHRAVFVRFVRIAVGEKAAARGDEIAAHLERLKLEAAEDVGCTFRAIWGAKA